MIVVLFTLCWKVQIKMFTLLQSLDFTAVNPFSTRLCKQYFMLKILKWHTKQCSLSWEYCLSDYLIAFSIQGKGDGTLLSAGAEAFSIIDMLWQAARSAGRLSSKEKRSTFKQRHGVGIHRFSAPMSAPGNYCTLRASILASLLIFIALFNHCCCKK